MSSFILNPLSQRRPAIRTTVPPVGITGSTYFDCDQNRLFISNGGRWIPLLHHEESTDSNESDAGSRAISSSYQASLIQAFKTLILPAVIISSQPLGAVGSSAFDTTTQKLFYSNGTAWVELLTPSFPITISSTGSGVSIVNNGVSPSFTLKSLVGSNGVTITPGVNEVDITGSYIAGANVTIVGNVISAIGGAGVNGVTAANSTIVVNNADPTTPTIAGNYVAGQNIVITGNSISTTQTVLVSGVISGNSTIIVDNTNPQNPIISGGYVAGSNILITGNVISSNPSFSGVNSVTSGGSTIIIGGTPSDSIISGGYIAGSNVTITGNVISATSASGVNEILSGNSTIIIGGTGASPTISGGYVSGVGISITGNVISGSGTLGINSLTAGNSTVVIGGAPSTPTISGNYVAGTGITITGNQIDVVGAVGVTSFSAGVTGLLPNVATSDEATLSGVLNVQHGGTEQTTYTDGQLLIGSTLGNTLSKTTLTAGTGIGIANGPGSIVISNAGVSSLIAGSGVSVSSATGNVTISVNASSTVLSFSAGTTGFTPASPTVGNIVLAGVLNASNGGTGNIPPYTNGQILIGNGTGLVKNTITPGTGISIVNGSGTITISSTTGGSGVLSFSAGTTGLTPSISTAGDIVLAGTLSVSNGGTGQTTYANGQVLIGNGTGLTKNTLIAGTGISITNSSGSITITNSSPPSSVVMTSTGGTFSLVYDGTGPDIRIKGIETSSDIQVVSFPGSFMFNRARKGAEAYLLVDTDSVAGGGLINITTTKWSIYTSGFDTGVVSFGGGFLFYNPGVYVVSFQTACGTQDSFTLCQTRLNVYDPPSSNFNIMVANHQATSSGNLSHGATVYAVNPVVNGQWIGLYNGSGESRVYRSALNGNSPVTWISIYLICS